MIYFDTAYLLKCYLPGRGFAPVRQLFDQRGNAACCLFGRLEFVSCLRRAAREGRLPQPAIATALTILDLDEQAGRLTWLPLTPGLVELTTHVIRALPPTIAIRAADALHLVCARENGCQQVFTSDRQLLAAAPHVGISAMNVIP